MGKPLQARFWLALVLAAVLGGSNAHAHRVDLRPASDLEELRSRLADIVNVHHVPGAAIAVIENGAVAWSGGFGLVDRGASDPVASTSSFRAASLSKTITAMAMLKLVERGAVNLSDPVQRLAPELDIRNPWQDTDPVRIVHLLEHTAGFDDMHFGNVFNVADESAVPLLAAINRDVHALQVRWRPGTRFAYSNPGYAIAGYLVEKIAGVPYSRYVQREIFAPLGMTYSTMEFNNNVRSRLVQGYGRDGTSRIPAYPVYLAPANGLVTSAADMGDLVAALLAGGSARGTRVLRNSSVARMRRTTTGVAAEAGMGDAYGLGSYPRGTMRLIWHGHAGGLDGFSAVYRYAPEHGIGYTALLNQSVAETAMHELESQLQAYLARAVVLPTPEHQPVPPQALATLEGWYRRINSRHSYLQAWDAIFGVVQVSARPAGIRVASWSAENSFYYPVSRTKFRREFETLESLAFLDLDQGTRMVSGWQEFKRVSTVSALGPLLITLTLLVLLASALLVMPVVLITRLVNRRGKHAMALPAFLAFLAAATFFAIPMLLNNVETIELTGWNGRTIGLAAAGLLFILLSALQVFLLVRYRKAVAPFADKAYLFSLGTACALAALGLMTWGAVNYTALAI